MLHALIVDDEQHCIDRIAKLAGQHTASLQLVGSCGTVSEALKKITALDPDVVFLDVHLGSETGFDLLKRLHKINFEIIFTTAFDSYAVDAFKYSALDYLLKPIDQQLFKLSIDKLIKKNGLSQLDAQIENLLYNLKEESARLKKIAIPTLEGLDFIQVDKIIRCQSDGSYTNIYLAKENKLTVTKTLKYMESQLDPHQFFRTHQSHLINLNFAEKYLKGKGGYVLMSDGSQIEVAVRRKEEFLKRFSDLH